MTRLHRLGVLCATQPRRVLRIGLRVAALMTVAAIVWGGELADGITVPGSDSQRAIDLAAARDPAQLGVSARIVLAVDRHQSSVTRLDTPEMQSRIADVVDIVKHQPKVEDATPLLDWPGSDHTTTFIDVTYQPGPPPDAEAVEMLRQSANSIEGVRGEVGGMLPEVISDPDAGSEAFGLLAALVILLVAFGSIIAAGLPLLLAIAGLGVGFAGVLVTARCFDVPSLAPQLASMIGLGVGIDYSLIIITRYRQLVAAGADRPDAIATAVATAGRSVLFAGMTVVISICGLFLTGIELLSMMGVATSICVAVTVLANLTLLPALLAIIGPRIDGWTLHRRARKHSQEPVEGHVDIWTRWASLAMRHAKVATVGSILLLLALAAPALSMQLGYNDASTAAKTSTERKAYDLLHDGLGPGANGTLSALVDLRGARRDDRGDAVQTLATRLQRTAGVAAVGAPVFDGDDVAAVPFLLTSGPQDVASRRTVARLRTSVIPDALRSTGAVAHIGGPTAIRIDFAQRVSDRLPLFVGGVVAVSMILLLFVFRAVVVALKAALMNLLSIGAAYGVVVAVFQWGWGSSMLGIHEKLPIDAFVPVFLFAIIFGLSMDYEVFLLSRIREEYDRTSDNDAAVLTGISTTAHVITSAALVMVGVFASFLLGGDPTVKMFGVGLTTAVVVDVTVVRMFLLPAMMKLLGRANWWRPVSSRPMGSAITASSSPASSSV